MKEQWHCKNNGTKDALHLLSSTHYLLTGLLEQKGGAGSILVASPTMLPNYALTAGCSHFLCREGGLHLLAGSDPDGLRQKRRSGAVG